MLFKKKKIKTCVGSYKKVKKNPCIPNLLIMDLLFCCHSITHVSCFTQIYAQDPIHLDQPESIMSNSGWEHNGVCS